MATGGDMGNPGVEFEMRKVGGRGITTLKKMPVP